MQSQLESDKNSSTAVVELNQMALTRACFIFYEKQSIKIILFYVKIFVYKKVGNLHICRQQIKTF